MSIVLVTNERANLRRMVGQRPWWMTTARIDRNPFTFNGLDYCTTCRDEVDTDTEAQHRGTVYVYRKRCMRCGQVVAWGSFDNVPLMSKAPIAAVHWAMQPGQDRR